MKQSLSPEPVQKLAPLLSLLCGTICALSMPPLHIWLTLALGLCGFYLTLTAIQNQCSKKWAFLTGWCFGFGYFVISLKWIGNALLVEGNGYEWAYPLAVCGLPALLSIFWGLAAIGITKFTNLKTILGFFGFAAWIMLAELARGTLLTGFPWNLFGYTWANALPVAQIISYTHIYALTLLTSIWMSAPAFLWLSTISKKAKFILGFLIALSFLANFTQGMVRLNAPLEKNNQVNVKIIQPNINQADKWKPEKLYANFLTHIDMSRPDQNDNDQENITYIIWPETATSSWVLQTKEAQKELNHVLNLYKGSVYLITGVLNLDKKKNAYTNAIITINKDGDVIDTYNKNHLVPFGEYIPFQKYIPIGPVSQFQGFEVGKGLKTVTTQNLSFTPLICYEIIFPNKITQEHSKNAKAIINVTNDAWYGISAGPHQHLAQAQFRAIETGLPVIRAAGTGISATIDGNGVISHKSELNQQIILNAKIKSPRQNNPLFPFKNLGVFSILILTIIITNSLQTRINPE